MFRAYFIALFCPVLLFFSTLNSQSHCLSWSKNTLSFQLNRHIQVDLELQHRRQNGLNNCFILENKLGTSLRSWVHYQKNEFWKFSFSPIAWFSHNKLINSYSNQFENPEYEIRTSVSGERKFNLMNHYEATTRLGLESRHFISQNSSQLRLRNRLSIIKHLNKYLSLNGFIEVFIITTTSLKKSAYEHNRIGLSLSALPQKQFRVEATFIGIYRNRPVNLFSSLEKNLLLSLCYTINPKEIKK